LIEKGKKNIPLINDFVLTTHSGTDTTEALLKSTGEYYLLFIKEYPGDVEWSATEAYMQLRDKDKRYYVVTSQPEEMDRWFNKGRNKLGVEILTCDATAIKTAARVNPTLYLMKGPIVQKKLSWADFK
jgi:hypothetical protein